MHFIYCPNGPDKKNVVYNPLHYLCFLIKVLICFARSVNRKTYLFLHIKMNMNFIDAKPVRLYFYTSCLHQKN